MQTRPLRLRRLGAAKTLTQGSIGAKLEVGVGHQPQA